MPLTRARTVALLSCVLWRWAKRQLFPPPSIKALMVESIEKGLQWKQGEITIGDNLAKLNVPSTFRFIGPTDTQIVLTKLWANP
jgi:hypothetical protein